MSIIKVYLNLYFQRTNVELDAVSSFKNYNPDFPYPNFSLVC